MYPFRVQQGAPLLVPTQAPSPVLGMQSPAPYTPYVTPTQGFDFSSIIDMMIPLMGLMMILDTLLQDPSRDQLPS